MDEHDVILFTSSSSRDAVLRSGGNLIVVKSPQLVFEEASMNRIRFINVYSCIIGSAGVINGTLQKVGHSFRKMFTFKYLNS